MSEIQKQLEALHKAVHDFKETNDTRAGKNQADVEAKLAKINDEINKAQDRLKVLETVNARPEITETEADKKSKTVAEGKKAFNLFLRKGKGGIHDRRGDTLFVGASPEEEKTMSVDSNVEGGFLVYPEILPRIVTKVFESSPIRALASAQQIGSDVLEVWVDIDEPASAWVSERQARSATQTPTMKLIKIPVHELEAMPQATQKMLDDAAFDLETWLSDKVAAKFSRAEATAFVTGTGVGQPRGFCTYPSGTSFGQIQQVNSGSSGAFTADGIFDVLYALKDEYQKNATFLTARASVGLIRKLKDSQNRYLWEPSMQLGQPETLLGRPLYFAADMAAAASASLSLAVGDFKRGYQIADRIGLRVLRDPYSSKPNVQFYTTARVGGDVIDFEAIKLLKLT